MLACEINKKLLPMKMHFFIFYAGISSCSLFMPVHLKHLGISATGVGIIFTVAGLVGAVAKPVLGAIADRLKNMRLMSAILILVITLFFYGITFIPPTSSKKNNVFYGNLSCNNRTGIVMETPDLEVKCLETLGHLDPVNCTGECTFCDEFENGILVCDNQTRRSLLLGVDTPLATREDFKLYFPLLENHSFFEDCVKGNVHQCLAECRPSAAFATCLTQPSEANSYNFTFWLFLVLFLPFSMAVAALIPLSDAACYEMLKDNPENYGRQRLYGTLGCGIGTLLTGFLVNLSVDGTDFMAVFYVTTGLLLLDIIVIVKMNLNPTAKSKSITKDVGSLLKRPQFIFFLLAVFGIGLLTALQWTFFFLYLKELGATPLLLGLTIAVQTIIGETPIFIYAGQIVAKIGHLNAISVSFAAHALRYICYSFLGDPWYVLPVEVTHGVTFGLFYTAMTSYAKQIAPEGTESTVQGLVGAIFECLGISIGNVISGLSFDYYGGRSTYCVAAIFAAVGCVLNWLHHFQTTYKRSTTSNRRQQDENVSNDEDPAQKESILMASL